MMEYGLPDKKKYPMPDKKHVLSAIKFFNYVDDKDEKELAKNINKRIDDLNMKDSVRVGDKNRFKKYFKESSNKEELHPVYIVVSFTDTLAGKIIKGYTKDQYTHASLALSSDLEEMYTYNMGTDLKKGGGLSFESISNYLKYNINSKMAVLVLFVKEHDFRKIKSNLDYYISNYNRTSYSLRSIFDIVINKAENTTNNLNLICSQFVDSLLKLSNIDITNKSSNIVTPGDLYKVSNPKVFKVYDGYIKNYNSKEIDKRVKDLCKDKEIAIKECITESAFNELYEEYANSIVEPVLETKRFPVQFTKDGDLIIKKYKKLDINKEYYNSVKLIKLYRRSNNIEGLKYEASKLWFYRNILQERISSNEDIEYNTKLQAKIVNSFSQIILDILREEKDFNFTEYYESSPFSDVDIRIDGSTIQHSINILKLLLK